MQVIPYSHQPIVEQVKTSHHREKSVYQDEGHKEMENEQLTELVEGVLCPSSLNSAVPNKF